VFLSDLFISKVLPPQTMSYKDAPVHGPCTKYWRWVILRQIRCRYA